MSKIDVPYEQLGNLPVGGETKYWLDPAEHEYEKLENAESYIQDRCDVLDIPNRVEFVSFGIRAFTKHVNEGAGKVPAEVETVFWRPYGSHDTLASSLVRPENPEQYKLRAGLYAVTQIVELEMTPLPFGKQEVNLFSNLGLIHALMQRRIADRN